MAVPSLFAHEMRSDFRARRTRFRHPGGVTPYPRMKCAGDRIRRMREAFSGFTGVPFFAVTPQLCLRRHHLFSRKRKDGGEKSAWGREIALTRGKTNRYTLRIIVTPAVKERPSGSVLTNSISLASAQARKLVHSVARPFQNTNASLVCVLVFKDACICAR